MSHNDLVSSDNTDSAAKAEATRDAIGAVTPNRARPMTGRIAALAGMGMAAVLPLVIAAGGIPTTSTFVR
jgi:hypothetical protein